MRTKTGWSIVILVVSVQLVLLLISVMALFSWFLTHTESTLGRQVCNDNHVIGRNIAKLIDESKAEELSAENIEQVRSVLLDVVMPNRGFICVVDTASGNVVASSGQHLELVGLELGSVNLVPLDSDVAEIPVEISNAISNSNSKAPKFGRANIDSVEHFVSLAALPAQGGILLTGQNCKQATSSIAKTIIWMRQIFFVLTLFIGFACLCLTVSTLTRMSAKVEDSNILLEREVSDSKEQVVKTQCAVIFGLAKLAESRDNDTGEHLDRIRSYVMILSKDLEKRMGDVDSDFVRNIALASSLHDIGKVGIPDSILLKPGRLSAEEREIMELHTLIGGECLEAIQDRLENNVFMHFAKQVAYYHHERWDGKGYPHGLEGEDIPLVARIVAVADVYDALTSKRPYKQPLSHLESKAIILSGSGSQFDPEIVDAFLRHEDEFEAISKSQQNLTDEQVRSDFQELCERAQPASGGTDA